PRAQRTRRIRAGSRGLSRPVPSCPRPGRSLEADAVGHAYIVARRVLRLHERAVGELQESLALAQLAADLELEELALALVVEQQRGNVGRARAAVGVGLEAVDGESRPEAPRPGYRAAAVGADRVDAPDHGVAVRQRADMEVAGAPEARAVELPRVGEEQAARRHRRGPARSRRRAGLRSRHGG